MNEVSVINNVIFLSIVHLWEVSMQKERNSLAFKFKIYRFLHHCEIIFRTDKLIGYDVSSLFRLDPETGAVYLKAGSAIDFETSTGYYHAGTEAYSYIYGPDYDLARPLIFSVNDGNGETLLTCVWWWW